MCAGTGRPQGSRLDELEECNETPGEPKASLAMTAARSRELPLAFMRLERSGQASYGDKGFAKLISVLGPVLRRLRTGRGSSNSSASSAVRSRSTRSPSGIGGLAWAGTWRLAGTRPSCRILCQIVSSAQPSSVDDYDGDRGVAHVVQHAVTADVEPS